MSPAPNLTPGKYPKESNLHVQHGESLKTTLVKIVTSADVLSPLFNQITMLIFEEHGKDIYLNLILSKNEVVERIRLSSVLGLIASHLQGDEEGES
jgi:hypothetical protein